MKNILLTMLFSLIVITSFGQAYWNLDFDNPYYSDRIYIDTIANPNCSWQVGKPTKTIFLSAHSVPNVIVTDTLNPLLANDTSIFYLKHVRNQFLPGHIFILHFWYQLDGDSTDYGKIEISPNNGQNWINVLQQDTTYHLNWYSPKPLLTGTTTGWAKFDLGFEEWASGFGAFPISMTADTILFRFTYTTDNDTAQHDGWMIDNFTIEDWIEGINEIQNDDLISVYPNPVSDELRILRNKPEWNQKIQIISFTGQTVYENFNYHNEIINTKSLQNGIDFLKFYNSKNFAIKRFEVRH